MDIKSIVDASKELAFCLTDIVGIIDKNVASSEKINERRRAKRVLNSLLEIQKRLYAIGGMNRSSIVTIAEIATRRGVFGEKTALPEKGFRIDFNYRENSVDVLNNFDEEYFRKFLECLIDLRDAIKTYKADIIEEDFKLAKEIEDVLNSRICALYVLRDSNNEYIEAETAESLFCSYNKLIEKLDETMRKIEFSIRKKRFEITK